MVLVPSLPASYRRVLVTGGTGFVGQHLVPLLRSQFAKNADVVVGARGESGTDVILDLADPASIRAAVSVVRPDLVIHLAGEASVAAAENAAELTWRTNVVGTLELAAASGKTDPSLTFFFVSSAEVYGNAFLDGEASEAAPPRPISAYAQSKFAAEQMLEAILPRQARLIVVRPSNHLGRGQGERFALPSFAQQIVHGELEGRAIRLAVGNLDAERDFMDVRDVVRGYLMLIGLVWPEGARETINIAAGVPRSVRSLLDIMRAHALVESEVTIDPSRFRAAEIQRAAVNSERLVALTGWRPAHVIEETVTDVLNDWRERIGTDRREKNAGHPV
jgi:GDP-4-dehydro-6-deoxy-D-mannose reductase